MKTLKSLFLNERFILTLILLNSLVIFVQEFDNNVDLLDFVEPIFTVCFIVEMIIKMRTYGIRTYFTQDWNRLDFLLVLISMPSLVMFFHPNFAITTNVFLTLRALRVFKFLRVMRFMPDIKGFMVSFRNAIKASYIVLFGFAVLLFIVSLVNCSLYKTIAPEFFNNPLNSLYSTFRIFSVEGWYEIPDLIAERSNGITALFTKIYFVLLLFGGGIIGLSLVNSIFVDAMVSDNNDELIAKVEQLNNNINELQKQIEQLNNSRIE